MPRQNTFTHRRWVELCCAAAVRALRESASYNIGSLEKQLHAASPSYTDSALCCFMQFAEYTAPGKAPPLASLDVALGSKLDLAGAAVMHTEGHSALIDRITTFA